MSPPIFILTGASGVGKTSIAQRLLQRKNPRLIKVITSTTRTKRPGETAGRDYRFYRPAEFKNKIAHEKLFEWAKVYGQYYGSLKTDVARALGGTRPILMVVNIQGAKSIKKIHPEAITIFIDAPLSELKRRLLQRGTTGAELKLRQKQLVQEKKFAAQADYVILNPAGQLARAVQNIVRLMMNKMRNRLTQPKT
jgi:guanylate kinase